MQPTPTTRDRHALRWVLGAGLVFVVVSGMALQVARERADEQWRRVVAHWEETWLPFDLGPSWSGFRMGEGWTNYDSSGSAALGDVLNFPGAQQLRAGMLADGFTTLAELLSAAGYRTGAFVAGPWLHRDFGLLQGFDHRVDDVTDYNGRPASEMTRLRPRVVGVCVA